jgi:hypothetical protein
VLIPQAQSSYDVADRCWTSEERSSEVHGKPNNDQTHAPRLQSKTSDCEITEALADPADIAFACPSFRPHFAMKRPGGPPKCFLLLFEPFDRCAQPLVDNANERRQHARDTPQPATARLEG